MAEGTADDAKMTENKAPNGDVTTIGVNKSCGESFNAQNVPLGMPMPCIVILVHGVNDIGEAYQNQDTGICAGLNERLNRKDLSPHVWKDFIAQNIRNAKPSMVDDCQCIGSEGKSPIIPFYWGYRPVDKAAYLQDQQRYMADLQKAKDAAFDKLDTSVDEEQLIADYPKLLEPVTAVDLPYDAYVREESLKDIECNYSYTDQFFNYLDCNKIKNGGLFANATTNIPDMYGPGSGGPVMLAVQVRSRNSVMNEGDYSHPIYDNCHRIYQVFAAQRLADLIIKIRREKATANDAINIVAHSQGTIVTMLANFMVRQAKLRPADCVILNHSPYALESRAMESILPGNQQSEAGRVGTLVNFCQIMKEQRQTFDYSADVLIKSGVIAKEGHQWDKPEFSRNNFGKVYNYFCPNDQTVSLWPVQGFGWQGVPDEVLARLGDNFRQRVFYKDYPVGEESHVFSLPRRQVTSRSVGAYSSPVPTTDTPSSNADFGYRQRQVTGEPLPKPFPFKLRPPTASLGNADLAIAMAAISRDDGIMAEYIPLPSYLTEITGISESERYLTKDEIALMNQKEYGGLRLIRSAKRMDIGGLLVRRRKTRDEVREQAERTVSKTSQHSSIVLSEEVSSMSMPYDLAVGDCNAHTFDNGRFWLDLLKMADWRDADNPEPRTKMYYQAGILPDEFKKMMNHPANGLPEGVVNDFGHSSSLQWPYPWPKLK